MKPNAVYAHKECVLIIYHRNLFDSLDLWIIGAIDIKFNFNASHFRMPSTNTFKRRGTDTSLNFHREIFLKKIVCIHTASFHSAQEFIIFPTIYIRFNVISVDDIYKIDFILLLIIIIITAQHKFYLINRKSVMARWRDNTFSAEGKNAHQAKPCNSIFLNRLITFIFLIIILHGGNRSGLMGISGSEKE